MAKSALPRVGRESTAPYVRGVTQLCRSSSNNFRLTVHAKADLAVESSTLSTSGGEGAQRGGAGGSAISSSASSPSPSTSTSTPTQSQSSPPLEAAEQLGGS